MMNRKKIISLLLAMSILLLHGLAVFASSESIFSLEELEFIEDNPVIKIGIDPNFAPFEFFDSKGFYQGLSKEYLQNIEEISGLKFEIYGNENWESTYEKAVNGELDMLPCISMTKERQDLFDFSDPYYTFQRVIVINSENDEIKSRKDLLYLKVAVQKNSSHESYLGEKEKFQLNIYDNVVDALEAVAIGEEKAFIGNMATTQYIVKNKGIANLKYVKYEAKDESHLHFAVRKGMSPLTSILNKSLVQISEAEKLRIQNKWIGMEKEVDYSWIIELIVIIVILAIIIFSVSTYWIMKLKREIKKREEIQEELIIATEDAKRANEVKSDFLARMSHEIRTPLNGISGMAFLLGNTDLDYKQRAHLERIKQASDTMLGIINDILDFSKVEAGKIDIDHSPVNLDELIKNVLNIVAFKIEEKGLDFTLVRDPKLPNYFISDAKRIQQVFLNIINNGVKFTSEGGITLSAKQKGCEGDICLVEFSIKDTGIGIAKENMDKLFQPFIQEDSSITRRFGGTGLGLSISKNIVEIMGGEIKVESEVGSGTEFIISLPLKHDEEKEEIEKSSNKAFDGLKAIILDKTSTELSVTNAYLSSFGIKSELTTSTEHILKILDINEKSGAKAYDLLVIDYDTPEMGLEEFHRIIDEDTNLSKQPKMLFILPFLRDDMSTSIDSNHMYITKPIFPSILHDSLMYLFESKVLKEKKDMIIKEDNIQRESFGQENKVLIVEDNKTNQLIAKSLLEEEGISVLLADNGEIGVKTYEEKKDEISLILMDLHMPVMDGYQATKSIRSNDTDISIVALTADAITGVEEKCRAYGFSYFLSKPFIPEQFIKLVKDIIIDTKTKDKDKEILWDKELGLKMLGGNSKLFKEVINLYLIENQNTEMELKYLVDNNKFEEARDLVHKLKSSTGSIGARPVQNLAKQLQEAFDCNDDKEIEALYPHFMDVFSKLMNELKDESK